MRGGDYTRFLGEDTMTINLFGVSDALDAEDKKAARVKKALQWKLRELGRKGEAIEGANNALESSAPEEAPKSSNQT